MLLHSQITSGGTCEAGDECTWPNVVNCYEGWAAVGGSVEAPDGFENMRITVDRPTGEEFGAPTGWAGTIKYTANGTRVGQPLISVICAKL